MYLVAQQMPNEEAITVEMDSLSAKRLEAEMFEVVAALGHKAEGTMVALLQLELKRAVKASGV